MLINNGNHFFLGGNTPIGFYSLFHEALKLKEANRIFCFKGGPGTGKSSLMKEIGKDYEDSGHNIEYFHCSSDSSSLDCVLIKDLKVALFDGTAPHIIDPKIPGAIDEIVDLGKLWNEDKLIEQKNEILKVQNSITKSFNRAYRYFKASSDIYSEWCFLNKEAVNIGKFTLLMEEIKDKIYKTPITQIGVERNLFITAFTPTGIVTFIDDLINTCDETYVLNGPPGIGKHELLTYLKDEGLKRGFNIDVFHSPVLPNEIEHLFIRDLNICIVSSNELNQKSFNGKQIYMENVLDYSIMNANSDKISTAKNYFYDLLTTGLSSLTDAKKYHDDIENFYIPNMNFEKISDVKKYIEDKIDIFLP